jgi:hypothetical protein
MPHMFFFIGYLDLGAGSMLIQVILAGLLGFVFIIKQLWRRITAFFGRKPAGEDPFKESKASPSEEHL